MNAPVDISILILEKLEQIEANVRQLLKRDQDVLYPRFIAEVFEFTLNKPWPAGELIEDVRDGVMPFLEDIIDRIVGEDGSPAIKLGLWLEKHDGIEADGYRLDRVGKKRDVWQYAVVRV